MGRIEPRYAVNKIFYSIQDKGRWTGTAAVFIRLQGCDVECPWCDAPYTWEAKNNTKIGYSGLIAKERDTSTWARMSIHDIFSWIGYYARNVKHIVITGGEPLQQPIIPLIIQLLEDGYTVQVETSGTEHTDNLPKKTWVTVSPKFNMPGGKVVLPLTLWTADEVEMCLTGNRTIEEHNIQRVMHLMAQNKNEAPIYLQPISQSQDAINVCIKLALIWGLNVNASKFTVMPVTIIKRRGI